MDFDFDNKIPSKSGLFIITKGWAVFKVRYGIKLLGCCFDEHCIVDVVQVGNIL